MKNKYIYILIWVLCSPFLSYSQLVLDPCFGDDGGTAYYRDLDGDGYGSNSSAVCRNTRPAGYVTRGGDCNDNDADVYPGATERCDGKDNDCNTQVDEIPKPGTPSSPSVSNQCGKSVLTRGNPPSGIIWYWQNNASGQDKVNSAKTITRTGGSVYYLRAYSTSTYCWSSAKTVNYSVKAVPATPSAPSVSNQCGKSVLTRGNPPSGITWYWQSSASGTSTGVTGTSVTRTSGSTYYLRARHNSSGCWSTARTVNYSIKAVPDVPSAPSVSNQCGKSVLTRSNPPSGVTWHWQSSSSGTDTSFPSTISVLTRTSGSRYYLRARNTSSGCWSTAITVNYSIKSVPGVPSAPTVSNQCGKSVLTRSNPPSGVTWYWQSSALGTARNSTAINASFTATSGSRYYLRARNNTTGCWGTARAVDYSIKSPPPTPSAPSVSNQCGKSILTRTNPPSGVTWYWQSSENGTSTLSSSSSITRTSGSTYYLRARNNSTACWGTSRSVSYSIKALPPIPAEASVTNNCGNSVLTKSTFVPSGVTVYWQSSENGTSTSNANASITRTSGSNYYLRTRNNTTGCWGPTRTVNYSIKTVPAVPSAPSVSNQCGESILTRGNPPSGVTWYWQGSENGTSTSVTSTSVTHTSGNTYYLRAKHNSSGCWSDARTVSYSIKAIPGVPSAPSVSNECGKSGLTRSTPPSGITWYWQSSASGTSTSSSGVSITRTTGNTYYLRARNNSTACWGTARSVSYTIQPAPTWYKDSDGDGFAGSSIAQCTNPGAGYTQTVLPVTDCNDSDASLHPNTQWYADTDADGFGDPNSVVQQCEQPTGYVINADDQCPDTAGAFNGCEDGTYEAITPSNENYMFTKVYQKAMPTADQVTHNRDVIESIGYYDGLGRPKQQVAIKASPTAKDIITHIEYDDLGRQTKEYLPFERQNGAKGSFTTVNPINDINSYYQSKYADDFTGIPVAEINAYSESIYEASPLGRVLEQGAPGAAWKADPTSNADHTIKFDWSTNTADEIVWFKVQFTNPSNTALPSLIKDGFYAANELYVTITKDENWTVADVDNHTTKEYKNRLGQVVLKRTFNASVPHDTYYVYDDLGRLSYVIPPKVTLSPTDGVSDSELNELCYQYRYDYRNRLIEKKIPGKGWEYIVYNRLDQPVLTQDANLRKENSGKSYDYWLFTKYDALGRIVYTGKIINNSSRKILQSRTYSSTYEQYEHKEATPNSIAGTDVHYSKDAYPTSMQNIYTINYYDNYEFDTAGITKPSTVYGVGTTDRTRSLATGSKVRVLGTNDWITTVTYYDTKGRPIYVASKNEYLNTTDVVESKLDFVGKVLETKTTHTKGSNAAIVTIDKFEYDHMGRVLKQTQKINTQDEELIAANTYDELGQLVSKKVGGTSTTLSAQGAPSVAEGLQTVDYTYNVRGWLRGINDANTLGNDLFAFGINYNNVTENTHRVDSLYNGNISETIWKTANDNTKRSYSYSYDHLNRITDGFCSNGSYNLLGVTYDKMGNIMSLNRNGYQGGSSFGSMDALSYTYDNGNKLLGVIDGGNKAYGFKDGTNTNDDYVYDANGNMTIDQNKGISSITYNHLNLPETLAISNTEGTGNISYIYDAAGTKLKKVVTEGSSLTTTEYAGNYVYKNGNLEFFNQPEGYVEKEADGYKYVYQFKDHLDNIRLSYKDADKNGSISQSEIIQEKNYYPFGLQHKGYNNVINGAKNNHQTFQGQELEEELGKNTLAYQWRDYDPAIARFNKIDRFAEKYKNVTPYQFALNSPMRYTEIKGDSINLRAIQQYDKKNNTNYTQTIVDNLSEITGLQLSADSKTGMLGYAKDGDGNAIVTQVASEDENGVITDETVDGGSQSARNDLISAVDNKKTGFARINNKSAAIRGGLLINMGPNQIDKFVNGSNNVNKNTLGYGMTFLHEMHHSALGLGVGDDKSKFGATGGVVDRMNLIRGELSNQSFTQSYGTRTSYKARGFSSGKAYLPMGQGSFKRLNGNRKPTTASQKFIEF
ncbi:DUF6443 domain-containing protein [Aquimarina sp. 2304DJ70-9]|uniref:DUF6443 domain-containing protein n=1 Tax=Aquimarina penaris TaxID=3231044 RepID=UPI00346312C8